MNLKKDDISKRSLPCTRWHQIRCLLPSLGPSLKTRCCLLESTLGWLEAVQELRREHNILDAISNILYEHKPTRSIITLFTRGFRGNLTGSPYSIYSITWLVSVLYSRAFLVLAVTAALAGPWPMLLNPFTVMRYRLLPSSPVKTIEVSFLTVLCFCPDSSCSASFQ